MGRRARSTAERLMLGGRCVLEVSYHSSGPLWVPRPGLSQLSPADRERAAAWLAERWVPRVTHDGAYALLFGGGVEGGA